MRLFVYMHGPRLPRARTLLLWVVGYLATATATAPLAVAEDEKYEPAGIGDLMPSPLKPHGQGTLFEMYDPSVYQLDKQLSNDLTGGDLIDGGMHQVASMLMGLVAVVGQACVTIVQWTFKVVSLPEVEPHIADAIGAAAKPMAEAILPTALAVGMFLAWARRGQSSAFGQMAWVAASAAIATTFFTAPLTWVKGVDEVRQAGSSIAMTITSGGLSDDTSRAFPFSTPKPAMSGNARDDTLRKASDAVWRTYVATPWCVADLGSLNACKRWGPETLKRGTDMEDREEYLKDHMTKEASTHEAVQWRQGHTPSGRIGILVFALLSVIIFAAMAIMLAGTTLASLLGALMLLVCGVFFAALWCIPGRTRQWGVSWMEALIGSTVVSFVATMLLGSVMIVNTSLLALIPTYGWLIVSMLNIAVAVMAFKLKGQLDGIVSAGGAQLAGRGTMAMVGAMATRGRKSGQSTQSSARRGGMAGRVLRGGAGALGNIIRSRGGGGNGNGGTAGGPASSPPPSGGGGGGHTATITRTYPRPPSYPRIETGSYGDHAATRPGLPGGPGGPPRQGPGRPPLPPGPAQRPRPGQPALDPAARDAKAQAARAKHTTSGAGSGYQVRPGAPPPRGVPAAQEGAKQVIQGEVVDPAGPAARFRSYPPPSAQPAPPRTPPALPSADPPRSASKPASPSKGPARSRAPRIQHNRDRRPGS
ncbi:hypothetical protein [Streptomyces venezuelae]|uniref:hypothetical protein n=1 Tax=Streptomyces venezuelae TaxID=54571 RepID=UPI003439C794